MLLPLTPAPYVSQENPGQSANRPENGSVFAWDELLLSMLVEETFPPPRPWKPDLPMLPVLGKPFSDTIMPGLGKAKRDKLKAMLRADNPHCAYCGKRVGRETATLDHIIAKSRGGKNTFDNYKLCCGVCNNSKGSLTLAAWLTRLETSVRNVKGILESLPTV